MTATSPTKPPPPSLLFRGECFLLRRHDRPFKKREPSEVPNLRQGDHPGSPKDCSETPGDEEGNSSNFHLFRPKCIPVWGLRIFSWCFKIFFNNLKLLFFWSRSYAVYSRPEAGEHDRHALHDCPELRTQLWPHLITKAKGDKSFLQVFLSLYPLWMSKQMTESEGFES